MPVGNVTINVLDGNLGIVPTSSANNVLALGTCSLGTPNQIYLFSDPSQVSAQLGAGPLAEYAAWQLAIAGGQVECVPVNPSVVGVSSAVVTTKSGTSTGTMTTTGAPYDGYSVVVLIVSAGTGQLVSGGTVQAQISVDGNNNSTTVFIPTSGTYVIPGTNITLTFSVSATTFDFNDQFTFTAKAPFYASADLTAAIAAAIGGTQQWGLVHVIGYPTAGNSSANATASASLASTVDTGLTTAFNAKRFARAVMDLPPSADADLITAFSTFSSTRVRGESTPYTSNSTLNGRRWTRSFAWNTMARLAKVSPSVSPGRTADGSMPGVISIARDERKTPGLFDARLGVALTYIGLNGFYSDVGVTLAPPGSDYTFIMNGRVIDVACQVGYAAGLKFLNSSVRVSAATGNIIEADASGIEKFIAAQINAVLNPDVSAPVVVRVNRTNNILSTKQLLISISVIPVGYIGAITESIGFINPALVPVAA